MKRTLVNSLHPDDYEDIQDGIALAKPSITNLQAAGAPIVVPHTHRWWEYGTAIQMILENFSHWLLRDISVLDVGSGWSGLGPAISYTWDIEVTEYEPVEKYRNDRQITIEVLKRLGKRGVYVHNY